jgi:hypothetical protein
MASNVRRSSVGIRDLRSSVIAIFLATIVTYCPDVKRTPPPVGAQFGGTRGSMNAKGVLTRA